MRYGGVGSLLRGLQVERQLGSRKPEGPYYYLYLFAVSVRRQHQDKGIGHELMLPTLRRIAEEGASAHIESSNRKNLPFNQRLGFRVTGEVQVAPDGPWMWTLWREGSGVPR